MPRSNTNEQSGTDTIEREDIRTKLPKMYQVLLLNDDYTTMDFVVAILESVFKKSPAEAVKIMLHVHKQGRGLCGVFTKEIAEAKILMVNNRARAAGYPLKAIMEEE